MNLKLKMSLLAGGLVALVVAGFAAALYWSQERALLRGQRDQALQSVQALAEVCREAAIGGQELGLTNYLKKAKESGELLAAWCADESGDVLGHTDVSLTHTLMDEDARRRARETTAPALEDRGDAIEARALVQVAGRRAGTVFMVFSRAALRRRFEEALAETRGRLVPLAGGALAAGLAGAFALTALALRPLKELVDGVRAVAKGRLDHKIPVRSSDEVAWLAREFNQMGDKLGELDRLKQDFVNGVTHDLKTPLATVKVAVDLLQTEAEGAETGKADPKAMADHLFTIRQSMERLTHMIMSLLEVAHIEQGLRLDKAPTALDDVADRVVKSFALIARQKGLKLELVVETAVPPLGMDGAKMERALGNLVSNAVKYTEAGGVTVTVADRGGRLEARVADTGPGLPPEAVEKLFTKFFRVRSPNQKVEGTGLGLTVVRGIAQAHGGDVSVESAVGKGSAFTLWLPK